jgi:hypothetical protein
MSVTIKGSGQVPIQVVTATTATATSTTSTSYVATNLTATITPSNSANKILVIVSSNGITSLAGYGGYYTIYRNNATNLGGGTLSALNTIQNYYYVPVVISYLDSPSTTSATTYTMYISSESGSTNYANTARNLNTITLMEISGA